MIALTENPVDVILGVVFAAPGLFALLAMAVTWWEAR